MTPVRTIAAWGGMERVEQFSRRPLHRRGHMKKIPWYFLLFALGNPLWILGCGGGNYAPAPPVATFPVVAISDIHFDPFYDPTLFVQLEAQPASQWDSIFQSSAVKTFSAYGTDTNYNLLVATLASLQQNLGASPVVIFSGDMLGHQIPLSFCLAYNNLPPYPISTTCPPLDDAGNQAMTQFIDNTVQFVSMKLRASIGNVPVIFVPGNIDTYSANGAGPDNDFLLDNALTFYTELLNSSVDETSFLSSFTTLGSYSAEPLGPGLRVIALDSNPLALGNPLNPNDELTWLDGQLAAAQASNQKVWLVMHVPPGVNTTETAQAAAQTNSPDETSEPAMMWQPALQSRFMTILSKYPNLITLMIGGHTHMDEYRILPTGNILYGIPGISPVFGNNPAFKIFSIAKGTLVPMDYQSISFDLTASPVQGNSFYTFTTAYRATANLPLQTTSLQLYPQFLQSTQQRSQYTLFYDSGNTTPNPKTNTSWNFINGGNWALFACGISQMDSQSYVHCVNGY
jgi:sphingomyelin phosphodiesterase acid-like 3